MSHEQFTVISQIAGLILFVSLFVLVLVYVFWPGNKKRFEHAARMPLDKDDAPENETHGGPDGGKA
jgi:cytochrome c oxidase cbb3-type subunit 4